MITDSQFNDEDMYNLIKTEFGQLDRKTFKTSLLQYTDSNDLKPIRTSLFDLVRKSDNSLSEAKLIERTNRDNGQPPGEKLADDIYVIYQYIEGGNNFSDLKQCLSRSRKTTVASDENDGLLADIFSKLSNKVKSSGQCSDNSVVISMLMEVKQMINEGLKPLTEKIDKAVIKFGNEVQYLKKMLNSKYIEITNLQGQVNEYRDRYAQLQADIKLKNQELRDRDEKVECDKAQRKITEKITSKLDAIDTRLRNQQNTNESKATNDINHDDTNDAKSTNDTNNDTGERTETDDVGEANIPIETEQAEEPKAIPVVQSTRAMNNSSNGSMSQNNYIDYMSFRHTEDSSLRKKYPYDKTERPNNSINGSDQSAFRGVVARRRTKRIVLYNVRADKQFEVVESAVRSFAERQGVHVTFTKLLKRRENRDNSSYIMRVNINEEDYKNKVENNEQFWPKGVYWRNYVPYNNNQSDSQWGYS